MLKDGLKKFAKATSFASRINAEEGEAEGASSSARKNTKSADAAVASTTPPVDVVMLLAEPRVLQLLLEHCLDCVHEATASHKLPKVRVG